MFMASIPNDRNGLSKFCETHVTCVNELQIQTSAYHGSIGDWSPMFISYIHYFMPGAFVYTNLFAVCFRGCFFCAYSAHPAQFEILPLGDANATRLKLSISKTKGGNCENNEPLGPSS